ncbi:prepilin-type N-terminal cleavage/methylation domain-containing protein [Vibrio gallaecicus]|uniref:pilin n=1 Tax=Vibrio gallaecicus TaxID=552386 RepID=UPI0010C99F74|nr:pilin [Vibrio gallaecicus]MDN3615116.1 pilin [Vibrio gallaecicus]
MKNRNAKKQNGFTLIELMIVVGIIGILSAIAVPAYKSYVIKTEANTGVSIPKTLLSNIDMYIQENGAFPEDAQASDFGAATDMSAMGTLKFTKDGTTATNGTADFTFASSASLTGKKVTYTRSNSGWKCTHDIPATLLSDTLKGCKLSATP